jgi:hypothetical protein
VVRRIKAEPSGTVLGFETGYILFEIILEIAIGVV